MVPLNIVSPEIIDSFISGTTKVDVPIAERQYGSPEPDPSIPIDIGSIIKIIVYTVLRKINITYQFYPVWIKPGRWRMVGSRGDDNGTTTSQQHHHY